MNLTIDQLSSIFSIKLTQTICNQRHTAPMTLKIRSRSYLPTIILAILVLGFAWSAHAETAKNQNKPLTQKEFDAVITEIKRMRATKENAVNDFVVHEATPERIKQAYAMPQMLDQPTIIRENGLIFAGQGTLLSFDKPSDVIAKVSTWFPTEVAKTQEPGSHSLFRQLHLFGPFARWQDEPAAFMGLWNCMPQIAWATPEADPFRRRLKINSLTFYGIAARELPGQDGNFKRCIHQLSGYRTGWTIAEQTAIDQELRRIGERVAILLPTKFSHFISGNRCHGSGPDDCVMVLHLWGSLSPEDPRLALAIQTLEADVQPDSPLPPLHKPIGQYERWNQEGEPRFDAILRKAAFLRAKLNSVIHTPQSWPKDALNTTLHQMTLLSQKIENAVDYRWGHYKLDASSANYLVNPWSLLPKHISQPGLILDAVLAEIRQLEDDGENCSTHEQWFQNGTSALQTIYAMQYLENGQIAKCGKPDWKWLKEGESVEANNLRRKFIDILNQTRSGKTRELILSNLTDNGEKCFSKNEEPASGWQTDLCKTWIHEPQNTSLALKNSKLVLDKRHQFMKQRFEAPTENENGQIKLEQEAWLASLTQGLHVDAGEKMRAYATALRSQNQIIRSATVWRHPGHSRAFIQIELANNEGTQKYLALTPRTVQEIDIPGRLKWVRDRREIARVSDLDEDGNLELWWAESFDRCQGEEADLERTLDCSAKSADMGEISRDALSYFINNASKTHIEPVGENWKSKGMTHPIPNAITEDDQSVCNNRLLMGSLLSTPLGINFGEKDRGEVIDLTCKAHPMNAEQIIVALFHDLPDQAVVDNSPRKGFVIAVFDLKHRKILREYRENFEEDGSTRISEFSLKLDTARYKLTPSVRAFGVRMNIGHSPRYAEGGESDYLSLFVEEGKTLRPVLKNMAMTKWRIIDDGYQCLADTELACTIENKKISLSLAPTSTNGWRDLDVITTTNVDGPSKAKPVIKTIGRLRAKNKVYQ